MSFDANCLAGKLIRIATMLLVAACFSPCSLFAQERERETPPPPPLPPPQVRTHERLAIHAGRMFDGKDQLARQQVILVEGTRIVQVGSANDVHIPPGTDELDLGNATVLPGLIDGHTHIFTNGPDADTQMLKEPLQYFPGYALVPELPGLGIEFDEKQLAAVTLN